jgi:hypothetical protein
MSVIGADRLQRKLKLIPSLAAPRVAAALNKAASAVEDLAEHRINTGARSGRIYSTPRGRHQASAPGEYPKTQSGELVGSIFNRASSTTALTSEVGTALPRGKWLEFGTSRMAPRPWLRPSFLEVLPAARDDVYRAMATAIVEARNG